MYSRRTKILLGCISLSTLVFVWSSLSQNSSAISWTLATTTLMATLWITEAIPMGATSLLPIAIFPLVGVMDVKEVTPLYASHIIFLFIAGFLLAFAMEKWQLHKRIAYKIISIIGFEPKRILLGFILASFILSMWINNTATTIVLLAPALAIIKEFKATNSSKWFGVVLLLGIELVPTHRRDDRALIFLPGRRST
ncbi:MAG: SLC13 family permease [Bacteroidia bacterium]